MPPKQPSILALLFNNAVLAVNLSDVGGTFLKFTSIQQKADAISTGVVPSCFCANERDQGPDAAPLILFLPLSLCFEW